MTKLRQHEDIKAKKW